MKKRILSLACCAVLVLALVGCAGAKLPEGMDADTVRTAAETVVTQLSAQDYDSIVAGMDETMAGAVTADKLAEVWQPYADKLGNFTEFKKETITEKDGYAVAVLLAAYENGSVQFTLSYDTAMLLSGFYLK